MNISIRRTVEEDAGRLAEIQSDSYFIIYDQFQDRGNPCLLGKEDITSRLVVEKRFLYFTILLDDEIVGGIMYRRKGNGPFFKNLEKGEYYLQRIYVDPKMHRYGIARKAVEYCESILSDATCFYIDPPYYHEPSRKFCEAMGFKYANEREEIEPGYVVAFYKKEMS